VSTLGLKLVRNKFRDVVCGACTRTFITKEPRKLFCDPCGIQRRRNQTGREIKLTGVAKQTGLRERVIAKAEKAPSLIDAFSRRPMFRWVVITSVPFSLNVSKNRRWSNNGRGAVYLSQEVQSFQQGLIQHLREALEGREVKQAKVWLGLFVQKPNHRSDAVNAIDTICDALKKAIGVDDNWFCIDRVDWEVQKHEPQIYIKIAQEATSDMLVCSGCGTIADADTYPRNKHGPLGRHRVCS
jgi:Holliday junction resolvase RusA-like endonuclease